MNAGPTPKQYKRIEPVSRAKVMQQQKEKRERDQREAQEMRERNAQFFPHERRASGSRNFQ